MSRLSPEELSSGALLMNIARQPLSKKSKLLARYRAESLHLDDYTASKKITYARNRSQSDGFLSLVAASEHLDQATHSSAEDSIETAPSSASSSEFSKKQDIVTSAEKKEGWVGAYSPESRKLRIERFLRSRQKRVWTKKVKYDVRKNFADSRLRVKGRFVKKEDEMLMRDLMSIT
mmetsp:Transcript_20143/g.26080  ORF Transcript_20143/g.26080 Transcript_20143/m.26080 type:complete len:176 (+) Transcript_20143:172-699(+)|eukprot:CAMPEP_0116059128 /NCGR_PEP_ID=MMETSP0322-20121206/5613_1 /TAXON_ID=163516 /ORGANISM="Leptocylindrus danicus var. apora, Strain B651" /LENGTH=175 /DNA_ID=CAMNT_0003543453 /DNA_START=155 /DNA_END=685 /DNA_ORIENTATION=-